MCPSCFLYLDLLLTSRLLAVREQAKIRYFSFRAHLVTRCDTSMRSTYKRLRTMTCCGILLSDSKHCSSAAYDVIITRVSLCFVYACQEKHVCCAARNYTQYVKCCSILLLVIILDPYLCAVINNACLFSVQCFFTYPFLLELKSNRPICHKFPVAISSWIYKRTMLHKICC